MTHPFVCWSLPNEPDFNTLVHDGSDEVSFVVAPFLKQQAPITFKGRVVPFNVTVDQAPPAPSSDGIVQSTDRLEHIKNVQHIIRAIGTSSLDKVVLTTVNVLPFKENLASLLAHLKKSHPNCFVYWLSHPDCGMWMGATPEPLIIGQQNAYTTVSLAGTRVAESGIHPWGQKESLEQSMVTDYIKEQLAAGGAQNIRIKRAETITYGHLEHLRSVIQFETSDLPAILQKLHPTPAVCGTPLKDAMAWIERLEPQPRELYAGYLGVHGRDRTDLYVNLRCFRVHANHLVAYTGGGITFESDPDDEWRETRFKLNALFNKFDGVLTPQEA
jgi:isochorismate synthase